MRLGIFGGTFDPPHVGHLLAASDALEHLELDRLVLVPGGGYRLECRRCNRVLAVDATPSTNGSNGRRAA